MSCKVICTCDHCGKEVSPYIGKQWKAGFLTVGPSIDDIYACSKEHLTLALAKTFDIPLDASTLRIVTEKNDALNAARAAIVECDNMRAQIAEHEAHTRTFDQLKAELQRSQTRERELEKRLAELNVPITVNEPQKRFKYDRAWLSEQTDDALFDLYMDHVGFFDMNGTMLQRENMIETLAMIECDKSPPDTSTESGLPDAVLAAITLPTKPTKPLREGDR